MTSNGRQHWASYGPVHHTTWRQGCRCLGCHHAEGRRRYRELAQATKPVQVHGRQYTVRERLAIGTKIGSPAGLASQREIAAWLSRLAEDAVSQAVWDVYETIATKVTELEEGA